MPVVPFSPQGARAPILPPLDPHYLLMAAAQMHDEGRLIKPGSEPQIPQTVQEQDLIRGPQSGTGYEEWQTQGPPDFKMTDEPPQPDQTNDIMRHLYPQGPRNSVVRGI